jgi:hypothetical protein
MLLNTPKINISYKSPVRLILFIILIAGLLLMGSFVTGFSSLDTKQNTLCETESSKFIQDCQITTSNSEPSVTRSTIYQSSTTQSTDQHSTINSTLIDSSSSEHSINQQSTFESSSITSISTEASSESYYQETSPAISEMDDFQNDESFSKPDKTAPDVTEMSQTSGNQIWYIIFLILFALSLIANFIFFMQYNRLNRFAKNLKSDIKKSDDNISALNDRCQHLSNYMLEINEHISANTPPAGIRQNSVVTPTTPIWERRSNDQTHQTENSLQSSSYIGSSQPQFKPQSQPTVRLPQPHLDEITLKQYCMDLFSNLAAISPVYKYANAGIIQHNENSFTQETYFNTMQAGESAARFLLITPAIDGKYAVIPRIQKTYSIQDLGLFRSAYDFNIPSNSSNAYTIGLYNLAYLQGDGNRYILVVRGELLVQNV